MKKLIIALVLAMVMVVGFSLPAFAWGGENTDVDVSPIVIDTGGSPLWVGYSITASGTVTIVANATAGGAFVAIAVANSDGGFSVVDPSSATISSGSSSFKRLWHRVLRCHRQCRCRAGLRMVVHLHPHRVGVVHRHPGRRGTDAVGHHLPG